MRKTLLLIITALVALILASCSLTDSKNKPSIGEKDLEKLEIGGDGAKESTNIAEDTKTRQEDQQVTPQVKKISMKLYYANSDNSAVQYEERQIEVRDGAVIRAAVGALLEGPQDENLKKAIPDGTRMIDVNKKENVAIVNFSKEYNNFGGSSAEIVARISLVNTLTEFQGVEKVRILIEGKDLIGPSGNPLGDMGRDTLNTEGVSTAG